MTSVLLSIKPKYVEQIIDGRKKYEFRRSIFKREPIERVYVYSSSPVRRIVGTFAISEIIESSPETLWRNLGKWSGTTEESFFQYFEGKSSAYAIGIDQLSVFETPVDPMERIVEFAPPQSFCYMENETIQAITDPSTFIAGCCLHSS